MADTAWVFTMEPVLETRAVDPVGLFLHGLCTHEYVFVPGGLRVVDTSTGVTLTPGCCTGVEDWRKWFLVFDGDSFVGGHDPADSAELHGDVVRLTLDADKTDSPFFDVPVDQLRELLTQAERDLVDFHALATDWLRRQLPEQADAVSAALRRALNLRWRGFCRAWPGVVRLMAVVDFVSVFHHAFASQCRRAYGFSSRKSSPAASGSVRRSRGGSQATPVEETTWLRAP